MTNWLSVIYIRSGKGNNVAFFYIPSISGINEFCPELVQITGDVDRNSVIVSYDSSGSPHSYFGSDVWDFSSYVSKKNQSSAWLFKVDFSTLPTLWQETMRHAMYDFLWEKKSTNTSFETPFRRFDQLRRIARALATRGINSPSDLNSPMAKASVLNLLAEMDYSQTSIERVLSSLNALSQAGYSSLYFENIAKTSAKIASKNKSVQQTLCIPQGLAAHIFKHALDQVAAYHAQRYEIRDFFISYREVIEKNVSYNEVQLFLNASGFVSVGKHTPSKHKGMTSSQCWFGLTTVKSFYGDIAALCGTLIGGTTGMRQGEWFELSTNSYQTTTVRNSLISYLKGATTKLNGGHPMPHAWVCAEQTKMAIELMACITEPFRAELIKILDKEMPQAKHLHTTAQTLFIRPFPTNESALKGLISLPTSTLNSGIKRLAQNVTYVNESGVTVKGARLSKEHLNEYQALNKQNKLSLGIGDLWPLASHQYRRTFAVFFIRNGFGSFLQIKRQFAHIHLAMSMWYGRNSELAVSVDAMMDEGIKAEIERVNLELMTDILSDVYLNPNIKLSGGAGSKIQQDKENGRIIFSSRDDISDAIKRGDITVLDNGTSLCLNPNCDRLDCVTDPAVNSVMCKSDILNDNHALQRVKLRDRLITRYENTQEQVRYQPAVMSKLKAGIKACERVMKDHSIQFQEYIFS